MFVKEYFYLLTFISMCFFLSCLLLSISMLLVQVPGTVEKVSAYECGFKAFEHTRVVFDVRFYLVGILFLIFDLEIAYLFPWSGSLSCVYFLENYNVGLYSILIFLWVLTLGFLYEWMKGGLDWE